MGSSIVMSRVVARPHGQMFLWPLCVLALLAAMLLPAPAPAQDGYVLDAGDRVRVTVFGEADLSGEFQIDGQGTFSMSLIGTVTAGGKTPRGLEQHIATLYRDGYLVNPQIGVEVLNFRPFAILGEVRNPGSFPYREGLTVLSAIALAGGFTFRADEDDIRITREGVAELQASPQTLVQPGDSIYVTERFF